MWVDADGRHTETKELLDMLPDDPGAVPTADVLHLADVQIQAARTRRKVAEVVGRPVGDGVVLDKSERPTTGQNDPHCNYGFLQLLRLGFHLGWSPPAANVVLSAPEREQW